MTSRYKPHLSRPLVTTITPMARGHRNVFRVELHRGRSRVALLFRPSLVSAQWSATRYATLV